MALVGVEQHQTLVSEPDADHLTTSMCALGRYWNSKCMMPDFRSSLYSLSEIDFLWYLVKYQINWLTLMHWFPTPYASAGVGWHVQLTFTVRSGC